MARHIKFADSIYMLQEYLLNKMEKLTGKPRIKKDRKLLQFLGTEWGRETFGPNVWVDIVRREVNDLQKYKGNNDTRYLVVIDDARFENEFLAFLDALKVRLECPAHIREMRAESWPENSEHPSETGLDHFTVTGKFDLLLFTDTSTTEDLTNLIFTRLEIDREKRNS
ncbi:MAG: hypothetical protein BWZ03_00850 [bacterium ADurb.BinA186]|nr:MAG: hypothetical protein BWZ03_00850 [bacterium ADurb.BinA186]